MTTWTDSTDTGTAWASQKGQASVWDEGASVWDQNSNVSLSAWDVESDTTWTGSTDTGTVWS